MILHVGRDPVEGFVKVLKIGIGSAMSLSIHLGQERILIPAEEIPKIIASLELIANPLEGFCSSEAVPHIATDEELHAHTMPQAISAEHATGPTGSVGPKMDSGHRDPLVVGSEDPNLVGSSFTRLFMRGPASDLPGTPDVTGPPGVPGPIGLTDPAGPTGLIDLAEIFSLDDLPEVPSYEEHLLKIPGMSPPLPGSGLHSDTLDPTEESR